VKYSFEELCEFIRLVGSTEVASLKIKDGECSLVIEGKPQPEVQTIAPTIAPASVQVAQLSAEAVVRQDAAAPAPGDEAVDDDIHIVTSPIVGTFYRAPSPDSDPYVKPGDYVEKGQVLCIVEAMKLMNEIEADASGAIVKIMPQNAEPVEFGQSLFAIKTA
jgi:acetyl-CoA carboxylase biotin carboxyl carrier protein